MDAFGITHPVGGDYDEAVWDLYALQAGRPQYIVIDRRFDVVHIGRDRNEAESLAASLL